MKIFGLKIMSNRGYEDLVRFKSEVEEILRRRLPIVLDKTLKNKNIILSRGLVLVNSKIETSYIRYKSNKAIQILSEGLLIHNIFSKIK
ncbi:MAG: hypothetical protein ACTSPI_01295 [Candidatus Heimdallarchaeaceae archaeon]